MSNLRLIDITRHLWQRDLVPDFVCGGFVPGYGGGDTYLAMLEDGQFVVNKVAAANHRDLLVGLNEKDDLFRLVRGKRKRRLCGKLRPAMLEPGEFVVNKYAAREHHDTLMAINDGSHPVDVGGVPHLARGGDFLRAFSSIGESGQSIDEKKEAIEDLIADLSFDFFQYSKSLTENLLPVDELDKIRKEIDNIHKNVPRAYAMKDDPEFSGVDINDLFGMLDKQGVTIEEIPSQRNPSGSGQTPSAPTEGNSPKPPSGIPSVPFEIPDFENWTLKGFGFGISALRKLEGIFDTVHTKYNRDMDFKIPGGFTDGIKEQLGKAKIFASSGQRDKFDEHYQKIRDELFNMIGYSNAEGFWDQFARGRDEEQNKAVKAAGTTPKRITELLQAFRSFDAGFNDGGIRDDFKEKLYGMWSEKAREWQELEERKETFRQRTKNLLEQIDNALERINDDGISKTDDFSKVAVRELLRVFEFLCDMRDDIDAIRSDMDDLKDDVFLIKDDIDDMQDNVFRIKNDIDRSERRRS